MDDTTDSAVVVEEELEAEHSQASFFPPLWQQRRNLAFRTIGENHATSVIDYGCGEGTLVSFLVWESTDDHPITRLAGLDLIEERVKAAEDMCQPQEFELGANLRVNKLSIELYCGSVGEADSRLLGYDALACLEVIEHLDPEVLEKFWSAVLGTIRPKLVIVSTPNAEFNIYFPQLNYGTPESIFRNDDHRFEWTRQEFEDWCRSAAEEYGYTVSFTGVGMLAHSDPAVGFCSQFAILKMKEETQSLDAPLKASECHSLLAKIDYPVYSEVHTEEEVLEYLHNKIACIRPRLPEPYDEEIEYYTWNRGDGSGSTTMAHADIHEEQKSDDKQIETDKSTEAKDEAEEGDEVELGILELDDLWLSLDVRQRCKTRSRMIKILEMSTIVRVDLEEDKVRFDEENEVWKEYDRKNYPPEPDSDLDNDVESYHDGFYDQDEYDEVVNHEYTDHDTHNSGWDMNCWDKSGKTTELDSSWMTNDEESTDSPRHSWKSS
ncbi:Small RNA 2'-O-methyltransferase [Entomortierella lignicola]|nr:Small RNA 2'-O-methyltransferase [Entomortierella lignicola]